MFKFNWFNRYNSAKRLEEFLEKLYRIIIPGQVLTLDESLKLVESCTDMGCDITVRTCPCRRSQYLFSDTLPNSTDIIHGRWSEGFVMDHPKDHHESEHAMHRKVSPDEAAQLLNEFDRVGLIHQAMGYAEALVCICNCAAEVCIPMETVMPRGLEYIRKGQSKAVVNGECRLFIGRAGTNLFDLTP